MTSTAEATCSRMARIGRSMPTISTIVSMRASVSRGPLEWMVQIDQLVTGVHRLEHVQGRGSRTSPTTMRSGRMPEASSSPGRGCRRRPCPRCRPVSTRAGARGPGGVVGSAASSMVTMRSSEGIHIEESTLSVVVLRAPVLPDTVMLLPSAQASRNCAVRSVNEPNAMKVFRGVGVGGELADRQQRPVDRERRDHRVDPAAVGEAGVDHQARLVHPATDPRHDLVDGAAEGAPHR